MIIEKLKTKCMFGLILCASLCGIGYAQEQEPPLKVADIHKVMKEMFQQHVDKKEISANLVRNSFKIYIDQFDPIRIYLLDEEVRPYLQLTDAQVAEILEQYKNNDLSAYKRLNELIQKSIVRARKYRKEIEANKSHLFPASRVHDKTKHEDWRDADLHRLFPKNAQELQNRIKQDIVEFIQNELRRYGEQVMKNESQTLDIYEKNVRQVEDDYLFTDEAGLPLSSTDQENLFVLHVLKALAGSLDAHTKFLSNTEAYDMKVRLQKGFQGIGVNLREGEDGSAIVSGFVEGSSAAKSNEIKIGDRILEIDGHSTAKESFEKVLDLMRDSNAATTALTLKRTVEENGKQVEKIFHVTLKREAIAVNEGRVETNYETVGNGIIGIITLHSFYQGDNNVSSDSDVRAAIENLDKKGNLRGLILDLRDNTGGFLTQAVKVGGLFISSGVIVISKYFNGDEHYYRDIDRKASYEGPLVVLTSKETASAAEIVAQALQDYGVALIVGDEHTYGKGTIQSQTVTTGGSSFFKVTVGKYYTVSGKTPQMQGVKADIIVPSPINQEPIGEEYLQGSLPADKIAPEYADDLSDLDPTLKPWYMKYYSPNLQHKKKEWRNMLPVLKKNSEYRIAHNKNYQMVINQMKGIKPSKENEDEEAFYKPEALNPGDEDLQMAEAVNIVKDMIYLHSHARGDGVSAISEPSVKNSN